MWKLVVFFVTLCGFQPHRCQFSQCHDDPSYSPRVGPLEDVQYTWLGVLQYIHIQNSTPHYFRAPRVVLIARQFVISTALDAAHVPNGYALGNVVFGEYERDEAECGVTETALAAGATCEPAALLMPLADVLLHPEYKHLSVLDSVALLKLLAPVRSQYMVPACLPLMNYLVTRSGRPTRDKFYHIDFVNDVPRDIMDEEKEISRLALLPTELCYLYEIAAQDINVTIPVKDRIMCTTGCGFHSGAPSVVHEHTGHWSVLSLAQGGTPCPDPLRSRRPPPPPRHTLLLPYVPWITSAISGESIDGFDKTDPFGFARPRSLQNTRRYPHQWNGHWWMGGLACYARGEQADAMFKFYHEIFQVKPPTENDMYLTYFLELVAPETTSILCVKIGMPYQMAEPKIWGIDTKIVKARIPALMVRHMYKFQVEAWGYNKTRDGDFDYDPDSESSDAE